MITLTIFAAKSRTVLCDTTVIREAIAAGATAFQCAMIAFATFVAEFHLLSVLLGHATVILEARLAGATAFQLAAGTAAGHAITSPDAVLIATASRDAIQIGATAGRSEQFSEIDARRLDIIQTEQRCVDIDRLI